ncbi:MAG: DNA-3-methyladenine glycosylase I [Dokdonella sp.]
MHDDGKTRCSWAAGSAIERDYHDTEWGVPLHDDRGLFEFLVLEGAQAGLSWRTVLNKREHYRATLANFDITTCAQISEQRIEALLADPGLIRNRLKITSVRDNARMALAAIAEFGSLDAFLWHFVDGRPIREQRRARSEVPASTPLSERMSKELHRRGFRFVGTTICYAFMQATGMVNDHVVDCFRHRDIPQDRP